MTSLDQEQLDDIRPNDPRYVSLVVFQYARSLPEVQPLSAYEREVLSQMLAPKTPKNN